MYRQIGRLKVELNWLKKNLDLSIEEKRKAIEFGNKKIPLYRQCELLGLPRSIILAGLIGYFSGQIKVTKDIGDVSTRVMALEKKAERAFMIRN